MRIPRTTPSRPARFRLAGLALGAVVALYLALQAVAALPAVRAAARDRAEGALRARIGEVSLGEVRFDPLFRVVAGPLALGGTPDRPAVTIERLRLRASAPGLLAGRVELASARLHGVRVDATDPGALVALATARPPTRQPRAARGPDPGTAVKGGPDAPAGGRAWPRVHVRGLRVALAGAAEAGPVDLDVWPGGETVRADLRLPAGGRASGELRRDGAHLALQVRASGLRAEGLGGARDLLPIRVPGGVVSFALDLTAPPELSPAEGHVRLGADGLSVEAARLGPEPLGPFRLALEGDVRWEARDRRVTLRGGRLGVGDALAVAVSGELRLAGEPAFAVSLEASGVPWGAVTSSLPPALAPPPEAPAPAGDLDARLAVEGPLRDPARWALSAALDLTRMRAASRRLPTPLRGAFRHQPEGGRAFEVGPGNPGFVPLAELPEHVVRAVTTSEDAGFFGHPGFDFEELSIAMQEGLEAGRVVRGGSTITQQVAKNLWLSRDKVLARKFREALGAIALEAALPKARILEIYLNLAEWGPGVFGIGPAARHWFGKDARLLTPREAALLAAVIPNPVRFDGMRARGALTEFFEQRVSELLLRMASHGVLTDDALLAALAEPLAFRTDPLTAPLGPPSTPAAAPAREPPGDRGGAAP